MSYRNKLLRITMLCYIPIIVAFAGVRILSAFGLLDFLKNSFGENALNIFIQVGLLFCVSIFMFAFLAKTSPKNVMKFYGFRKIRFTQVLLSILIGIVVYILNVLIMTFVNSFLATLGYNFISNGTKISSYPFWLLLVNLFFTAVLPGVCEEVAHRGMLLNGFSQFGAKKAIILSGLLFGLLHLNIEQFFYATLIGMLVGYISVRSESIFPAMIIHFMNNAISVLMGYSSFHNLGLTAGFDLLQVWLSSSPMLGILFLILLIASLLIFLRFLLRILFKYSTIDRMNRMQRAMIEQYEKERFLQEVENLKRGDLSGVNDETVQTAFFENFDEKYNEKARQIGLHNDITYNLSCENWVQITDKIAKVMLVTVFVILGVITMFTFIWGLL